MTLVNNLQKIGLSDKEAKVYLAALELGQASVQEISKKSEVNRATTYVILDALIKKGLCSTYHKEKKDYFMAESPEMVLSVLELQKKEIDEKKKMINELMPQLRALYNQQEAKPVVRFFEGKEGLRTMIQEQMSSDAKILRMMFSVDDLQKIFTKEEMNQAYNDRVAKKVKVKALLTAKSGVDFRANPSELDQRLQVPAKDYPVYCDVAIFDNKIRIASLGDKLNGVIIEDENIYKTFVSLYELAWLGAQTLKK